MRRSLAILILLFASGCIGNPPQAQPPVVANPVAEWTVTETGLPCDYFCEPTIASDGAGLVFLLSEGHLAAGPVGGPFEPRDLPPVPVEAVPGSSQNDALLQHHAGRLYLSALITHYSSALQSLVLQGIQVASSGDGGKSWPQDTFVWLGSNPTTPGLGADRQWMVFGEDGVVHLGYQQVDALLAFAEPAATLAWMAPRPEGNVQVATSVDGGVSFGDFVNAVAESERDSIQIIGLGDVVDGTLFVPYYSYAGSPSSMVAISEDQGVSFRQVRVGPVGDFFPRLAHADDGLHYLSKSDEGLLGLHRSTDGGDSWTAGPRWEVGDVRSSPWAEAQAGGGLHLAWLTQVNGTHHRVLYRNGTLDHPQAAEVVVDLAAPDIARTYTDFLHFTLGPGDRPMIVYGDMSDGKVHVATRTLRVASE